MQPPPQGPQGPQGPYGPGPQGPYNQGPSNYPREPYGGGPQKFTADLVMGIILIVLAALSACGSLVLIGIGGVGTAVGTSAGGREGGVAATAGGVAMVIGVILLLTSVAYIVGGAMMTGSKRKGLMLVLVVGAILLVLNIISIVALAGSNIVGIFTGLIFPGYAAARLFGNFGPRPIES